MATRRARMAARPEALRRGEVKCQRRVGDKVRLDADRQDHDVQSARRSEQENMAFLAGEDDLW